MAIDQQQQSQLVNAYQTAQSTGDFSGLQGLVNQYGVTGADVQAFAPGFNVATQAPGIVLADTSNLINQAYGSVGFTDTSDPNYQSGVNYWANQLQSGALTPETFNKAFLDAAAGITDPNYSTYVTNAQNLINQYTGLMDTINAGVSDPVSLIRTLDLQEVTPEQVLAAQQYISGANAPTLAAINEYWEQGRSGFGSRFDDILTSTFGDQDTRETLADLLATESGIDPERVSFADLFDPEDYSKMSIGDISGALQSSQVNKLQDALTVSNIAQQYFGVDQETSSGLMNDLLSGKSDNELANKVFDELLKNNKISNETGVEILQAAAQANPEAPIFQENPEYLAIYSPLGETTGGRLVAGQYGYVNGAPIISLDELTRQMGNSNQLSSSQDRRLFDYGNTADDKSGWDLFTKYMGDVRTGAALHGIEGNPSDMRQIFNIGDEFKQLQDQGRVRTVTDPESGEVSYLIKTGSGPEGEDRWESPESFFNTADLSDENAQANGRQNFNTYLESGDKLAQAARELGLNPADYDSTADLYDAINEKETRFLVTGNTASWDPEQTNGIGGGGVDTGSGQHARVLYNRVGDKLVPIKVIDTFDFKDPKTSGFQAQWAKYGPLISMATLPFGGIPGLMQTAGMTAGQAALASAALSTAASGGDFGDFATSFLTQQYVMPEIAAQLESGLGSLDLGLEADTLRNLSKFGAGMAGTALTGGNMTDYALSRGLNILADQALSQAGIDTSTLSPTAKAIVQSMLPTMLRGGDAGKAIFNTAMNIGQRSIDERNRLDRRTETPI